MCYALSAEVTTPGQNYSIVRFLQLYCITYALETYKVLYLHSKVTNCNGWVVIGKVNTWAFQ